MNKDAITATIELIERDQALSFNMGHYLEVNTCGTSCCLAGYANIAKFGSEKAIPHNREDRWGNGETWVDHYLHAKEYFGLTEDQADALFIPNDNAIETQDKDIGIRVLKTFRDTGEVVWDELVPYVAPPEED